MPRVNQSTPVSVSPARRCLKEAKVPRRRPFVGAVSIVILCLAAAACSSSTSSAGSTSSSSTAGGGSTGAVSSGTGSTAHGSAIEIGVVSADTAVGVHSNDVPTTVTLWQNWVNAHGGIGGHPVQVIEKDTQGSASTADSIVNQFAQDSNVIAIFDNDPTSDGTWAKTAAAAGLPVICMTAAQSNFTCQSQPNFFPVGSSLTTVLWAQSYLAKLANVQKISFFACAEAAQCATAMTLQKGWATKNGLDTVYTGLVAASQPSYAAPCLAAKSAGATGVVLEMSPTVAGKMADDCAAQSYHPTYTITSPLITPQNLADPNLNGTVSDFTTWPWILTDTPAQKEFARVMGSRWPSMSSFDTEAYPPIVWAALQLFAAAGAHLPASPTRQDVFNGIYSLGPNYTDGGLIPPQTIVKGKPTVNSCFFAAKLEDGKLAASFGTQSFCAPAYAANIGA